MSLPQTSLPAPSFIHHPTTPFVGSKLVFEIGVQEGTSGFLGSVWLKPWSSVPDGEWFSTVVFFPGVSSKVEGRHPREEGENQKGDKDPGFFHGHYLKSIIQFSTGLISGSDLTLPMLSNSIHAFLGLQELHLKIWKPMEFPNCKFLDDSQNALPATLPCIGRRRDHDTHLR